MEEADFIYEIDKSAINDLVRIANILLEETDAFRDKPYKYVLAHVLEAVLLDWAFMDNTMIEDLFLEIDCISDGMLRTLCKKIMDQLVQCTSEVYPTLNNTKLTIIQEYHNTEIDFLPDDRFFNQTVLNEKHGFFKITLN
jgi:hypothetical protein